MLSLFANLLVVLAAWFNRDAADKELRGKIYLPEKIDALRDTIFTIQEEIDHETRNAQTGDTIRLRLLNQRLRDKQNYLTYLVGLPIGTSDDSQGNENPN